MKKRFLYLYFISRGIIILMAFFLALNFVSAFNFEDREYGLGREPSVTTIIDLFNGTDTSVFVNCTGGEVGIANGTCAAYNALVGAGGLDGNASSICSGNDTYLSGEGSCNNLTKIYILQSEEGNLNVNYSLNSNSTTWWATVSGFIGKWFYKSGNNLALNETQLNNSIDDRTGSNGSVEWIKPEHIFDIDDADIEGDLNTYVDIAGDTMTGDLQMLGNNINGSGTYNTLSIIQSGDWIYLSGDGSIEEGLDIAIPIYAGRDFYYGYGGAEDHHFGIASALTIASDGDLITAGTGTFGNLDVDTLNLNGNVISDSTGTINFSDEDITTSGRIISTGGGETGKFLTGLAGRTVFAFSGGDFDIRAGDGISSSQNVMRVDNSGDIDFYAGDLTTTGDGTFNRIITNRIGDTTTPCFIITHAGDDAILGTATGFDLKLDSGEDLLLDASSGTAGAVTITSGTGKTINLIAGADITLRPSGDLDDYIKFSTSGDIPEINAVGSNLKITADGGAIDFDDENLKTTENITAYKLFLEDWSNTSITESQISDLEHTVNNTNINVLDVNASSVNLTGNISANTLFIDHIAEKETGHNVVVDNNIHAPIGNVSAPAYSFTDDPGAGMWYSTSGNRLRFSTEGVNRMSINDVRLFMTVPILVDHIGEATDSHNIVVDNNIEITGSAGGAPAVFDVTNNYSGASSWLGFFLGMAPNLANGKGMFFGWGKSASNNNRAGGAYNHISDGSTSNSLSFNIYGVGDLIKAQADGKIFLSGVYDDVNTSAAKAVYVQSDGQLTVLTSSERYKENIRNITLADTNIIDKLAVKEFDYINGSKNRKGLIAEDVVLYLPQIVTYERNLTLDCDNETGFCKTKVEMTNILDGINYGNGDLISLLITYSQQLKQENQNFKDCTASSRDFTEYKLCVGGIAPSP